MILRMNEMKFFKTVAVVAALLLVIKIGFAQENLEQNFLEQIGCERKDAFKVLVKKFNPPIQNLWSFKVIPDSVIRVKGLPIVATRIIKPEFLRLLPRKIDLNEPEYLKKLTFKEDGTIEDYNDYVSVVAIDYKYSNIHKYGSMFVLPKIHCEECPIINGQNSEVLYEGLMQTEYQKIFNRWRDLYPQSYMALSDEYKNMVEEDFSKFYTLLKDLNYITK